MPRKLTEAEIQNQKDYLYEKCIPLIKEKGITKLTLDEITQAAQMAKGSFYHYYKSKELFLYEVLKRNEAYYYGIMLEESRKDKDKKRVLQRVFEKSFLMDDCLFAYVLPEEQDVLLANLPAEYTQTERQKSQNNFQTFVEILGIEATTENYATLSYLMDGLQGILRSPAQYGEEGRKQAAEIMVNAIGNFWAKELETHHEKK